MKIWGWIILAGIIVAALGATYAAIYTAGYNQRDTEVRKDTQQTLNDAVEKRMRDWLATQEEAEVVTIIEEKIVEKIRVVEKKVPVVVEKIVELKPECDNLPEFTELLNEQIDASNSLRGDSPDAAAELVTGVPLAFELPSWTD